MCMKMVDEITYERDIHKSYMKIPAAQKECYDENIIVDKNIEGTILCEKCFVNGRAEFWYDITGKQGLDEFCKVNEIEKELFEGIVLGICNCLEMLEWNLVDASCFMLRPDLVFLDVHKKVVTFVLYPESGDNIYSKLQDFMEFLLTKISHENMKLVSCAYRIYEHILQGTYAISDIKQILLDEKMEMVPTVEPTKKEADDILWKEAEAETKKEEPDDMVDQVVNFFHKIMQSARTYFFIEKKQGDEGVPEVVYPEIVEETAEINLHPTVCLSNWKDVAQGILVYEGKENFADFEIGHLICVVGKSHRVKLQIKKDTISQFHAKIEWVDDVYYIEDMNSTNGTYVNEELLNYKERRALVPGDSIRFADVKYRFI